MSANEKYYSSSSFYEDIFFFGTFFLYVQMKNKWQKLV